MDRCGPRCGENWGGALLPPGLLVVFLPVHPPILLQGLVPVGPLNLVPVEPPP